MTYRYFSVIVLALATFGFCQSASAKPIKMKLVSGSLKITNKLNLFEVADSASGKNYFCGQVRKKVLPGQITKKIRFLTYRRELKNLKNLRKHAGDGLRKKLVKKIRNARKHKRIATPLCRANPGNLAQTPTPAPTAQPTETPSVAEPTPSPTATATPSPTATPSATPDPDITPVPLPNPGNPGIISTPTPIPTIGNGNSGNTGIGAIIRLR